jgi:hypothetical protein
MRLQTSSNRRRSHQRQGRLPNEPLGRSVRSLETSLAMPPRGLIRFPVSGPFAYASALGRLRSVGETSKT